MRQLAFIPIVAVFLALFSRAGLAQPSPTPKAERETGIEGVISAGPIHGGPTRQGVPDSRPLANIEFVVEKEKKIVASFKTDDHGRFRVSLPSGYYTVSRKDWNAKTGSYGPFQVDVVAGQMKAVQWSCDTGIR
ncbi:MAG TPA: hypothetical protein VGW39_02675 [Chthoniobacterales bacterium]|nr:hypothetical protein [Chthoniobacterales bacterium]